VLEVIRKHFHSEAEVLPEAASIVFGGGFPRRTTPAAIRAAQRSIFRVQQQLERLAREEQGQAQHIFCDRGTLDGLAYWPDDPSELLEEMGTTRGAELSRYALVVHLRPPSAARGFDHRNPLRIESAAEAARIDEKIDSAWEGHPRRLVVESTDRFLDKVIRVIEVLRSELHGRGRPLGLPASP
jgi:hypothetical protein